MLVKIVETMITLVYKCGLEVDISYGLALSC